MTDYFQAAFGAFDPQHDQNAAAKFVLNILMMDDRLDELGDVLTDGHAIGALEGDPGWIVERRDSGPSGDMPGYENWPKGANFRFYVDPSEFELAHPEVFLGAREVCNYLCKILDAYLSVKPMNTLAVQRLRRNSLSC